MTFYKNTVPKSFNSEFLLSSNRCALVVMSDMKSVYLTRLCKEWENNFPTQLQFTVPMKCTKVPGTLARTYANEHISTCGIRRACHFSQNG